MREVIKNIEGIIEILEKEDISNLDDMLRLKKRKLSIMSAEDQAIYVSTALLWLFGPDNKGVSDLTLQSISDDLYYICNLFMISAKKHIEMREKQSSGGNEE